MEAGLDKEEVCCVLFGGLIWFHKNHTDGWYVVFKLTGRNVYIMACALMFTSAVHFTFTRFATDLDWKVPTPLVKLCSFSI